MAVSSCVISGPYQRLLLTKDKLAMSSIEKIVDVFVVDEWSSIARLYDAVIQFTAVYKGQTFAAVESRCRIMYTVLAAIN